MNCKKNANIKLKSHQIKKKELNKSTCTSHKMNSYKYLITVNSIHFTAVLKIRLSE